MFICVDAVGQEIRGKLSGAVEAFSRKNGAAHGQHGDRSRHRTSIGDVPSSKDVVSGNKSTKRHTFT